MAITVSEPTATRDSNLSYYVAVDNPVIFTFTATASPAETQMIVNIYDATSSPATLINSFDIVLSFDSNNEIEFDVSPYLRSLLTNVNDFNYSANTANDTNASVEFYIEYQEFPVPSPSSYTQSNIFTAVKAAKQIGDEFGSNMAEFIDFTTQGGLQKINTPQKKLPFWSNYPFSIEGFSNELTQAFEIREYIANNLQIGFKYLLSNSVLLNHCKVQLISSAQTRIEFNFDDTPPNPFQFQINTANSGTSTSTQFTLPTTPTGTYNAYVFWGDGNFNVITEYDQQEITHEYGVSGLNNVAIYGTFRGWRFDNGGDKSKLLSIERFGNVKFGGDSGVFYGCSNLDLSATQDTPNLVDDTILTSFLRDCTSLTTINNFDNWDFSFATSIALFFQGCSNFNQVINNNTTTSVTTFNAFLRDATSFNSDITLSTDSCTSMLAFLRDATSFNSQINFSDTSNIAAWGFFLEGATSFNQPVTGLVTSAATAINDMFSGASAFNQDVSSFDVRNVTTANDFLRAASSFDSTNYSALLSITTGWASLPFLQNGVPLVANLASYNASELIAATSDGATSGTTLEDTSENFTTLGATVGDVIVNTTSLPNTIARITAVGTTTLTLDTAIMTVGDNYSLQQSDAAKGKALMVIDYSWTIQDAGFNP